MPLSADDRIILVRVKVQRAKKHLRNLERLLQRHRNNSQAVFLTKNHPNVMRAYVDLEELPKGPWDALSGAGDVVHNLRAALDHLAWQLVLANGSEPQRGITGFPIAENEAAYKKIVAGKVKGMRNSAIERIEALKPYKSGGDDVLWRIHELDNIDKHRTLLTAHTDFLFMSDWMERLGPFLLKTDDPHFSGFFDENVEKDMDFALREAITQVEVADGNAMLPTLHHLVDFVDALIVKFRPDLVEHTPISSPIVIN